MMYILIIAIVFPIGIVFAEDFQANNNPVYQNDQLIVPRIDTADQAGSFQDVIFQFDEQINAWKLLSFRTTVVTDTDEPQINNVELIIIESFPIQVFLKIDGFFFTGCAQPGQISQQLKENIFEVLIHADNSKIPPDTGCTTALVPFDTLIPLSVYGLAGGIYEYSVNGGNTGAFTLTSDNKL